MTSQIELAWRKRYDAYRESYKELLAIDPFENWEESGSPEAIAEDEFRCGMEAWLGGDRGVGVQFLRRAGLVADRALREKPLDEGLFRSGFPRNRAELRRIHTYSNAIIGETTTVEELREASRDFETAAKNYPERDSQSEGYLLAAVRAALLAGETDYPRTLLQSGREFSWHSQEASALLDITSCSPDEVTRGFRILRTIWQEVRHPDFAPDFFFEDTVARLELSALCQCLPAGSLSERIVLGLRGILE